MGKKLRLLTYGDNIIGWKYISKYISNSNYKILSLSELSLEEAEHISFSGSLFDSPLIVIRDFNLNKDCFSFLSRCAENLCDIIFFDTLGCLGTNGEKFSAKASSFLDLLKKNRFQIINNSSKLNKNLSSIDIVRKYSQVTISDSAISLLIEYGNGAMSYCMNEIDKISIIEESITEDSIIKLSSPLPPKLELYELSNHLDEYDKNIDLLVDKFLRSEHYILVLLEVVLRKFKWRLLSLEAFSSKKKISDYIMDFGKISEYDKNFYDNWFFWDNLPESSKSDVINSPFIAKNIENSFTQNIGNRIKSSTDLGRVKSFLIHSHVRALEIYRSIRLGKISEEMGLTLLCHEYLSAKSFANSF